MRLLLLLLLLLLLEQVLPLLSSAAWLQAASRQQVVRSVACHWSELPLLHWPSWFAATDAEKHEVL